MKFVNLKEEEIKNPFEKYEEKVVELEEGFRAGKTPEMIKKLMGVIGRKANISDMIVSPVPDYYANKEGSFIGFFVKYNGNEFLRFNFLKSGSSNKFYSIDKYDLTTMKPDYTIDLQGYNVVEVVDYISDILNGTYWNYVESYKKDNKLEERTTIRNSVEEWLRTNFEIKQNLIDVINSGNRSRVNQAIRDNLESFENFASRNNYPTSNNNFGAVRYHVKKILEDERVNASSIPSVEVRDGQNENLVSPGSEQEEAYNSIIENEHIFKFKALRIYCTEIKKGNENFKSLYIYGDGGIGKSHWVKNILGELPQTEMKTGKLRGYTGLVQTLYDNRQDTILVLDDVMADKDMKNPNVGNILKAALDPEPPRKVEILKASSGNRRSNESYAEKGKIYLSEEEYKEFEVWKNQKIEEEKKFKEESEFVDISEPIIDDSPDEFYFDSVVIFITNYKEVPQPIQDRCWIIQMDFDNNQILELIEESLKTAIPDANSDILDEAYEIADKEVSQRETLELLKGLEAKKLIPRKLSFRVFNRITILLSLGIKEEELKNAIVYFELGN